MRTAQLLVVAVSTFVAASPSQGAAIKARSGHPDRVDVVDAIECRLSAASYNGFAMRVAGKGGIASKRRWKKVRPANPNMIEYKLAAPAVFAGLYRTRRIAFTSTGVVAILDVPDPVVVAREVEIVDPVADPARGGNFKGFIGERVIADGTGLIDGKDQRKGSVIIRSVSKIAAYPGKSLYGCSYWTDPLD